MPLDYESASIAAPAIAARGSVPARAGGMVDERIHRVAALANAAAYDSAAARAYAEGAPHLKHARLRSLYAELVVQVYDRVAEGNPSPRVLDLGAGEGSATLPFLELGARVTAVDLSESQLEVLQARCGEHHDRLEVRCEDIEETLSAHEASFDIVVANSFLHHVPDYMSVVRRSAALLRPGGCFFCFQDPMRYDSLGFFTHAFGRLAYLPWRLRRGDVIGGLKRRLRRRRNIYLEASVHDNAEFHVVRNGLDQTEISRLLEGQGFDCQTIRYFSTQSRPFQTFGMALGLKNTFSVIARKPLNSSAAARRSV